MSSEYLQKVNITTNGSNPALLEAGIRRSLHFGSSLISCNLSCEGDEQTHNAFTGKKDSWGSMIESVQRLKLLRNKRFSVKLETIISAENDGTAVAKLAIHAYMRNARRLPNGNYLVAHYGEGIVREYDSQSKMVREIPAAGGPHSVVRLPNGNTLISCADGKGGSRVFEVDPAGHTVWQVQGNELPGVTLKFMAGLQRLPNGDTFMANWLGHNQFGTTADLIEVTPDKRVVWTFSGAPEIQTISSALILDPTAAATDQPEALH